jgi:hypothetical protein
MRSAKANALPTRARQLRGREWPSPASIYRAIEKCAKKKKKKTGANRKSNIGEKFEGFTNFAINC